MIYIILYIISFLYIYKIKYYMYINIYLDVKWIKIIMEVF